MTRRPTLAAAMLFTALSFTACGSATGPTTGSFPEHRVYVLRTMAGEALPAVWENAGASYRFDADTLRLEPDGTGSHVAIVFVEPVNGDPGEERWEARFTYEVRGDRFELSFVCPPDAISSCVPPPHYRGTLTADALRIDQALGFPTPLEYEHRGGIE